MTPKLRYIYIWGVKKDEERQKWMSSLHQVFLDELAKN